MLRLALRNLFQNKARLLISVGGVALALTLILTFDAIFTGAEGQLTVYIDNARADVWVSQAGVRTMHMTRSSLSAETVAAVKAVPGVVEATPIAFVSDLLRADGEQFPTYVIGLPQDAALGTPWRITDGAAMPAAGQVIIDRAVAGRAGISIGDRVTVLGQQLAIGGLTEGTMSLVSSVAFVSVEDFARMRGGGDVAGYVLVSARPGESPASVAARIERSVPGVTAQTRQQFATSERNVVKDMSADVITIMNLSGFLIGLAVMALIVYVATIARRREYGVLKALGAGNGRLYRTVLTQALVSVALGLVVGLALTLLLTVTVPRVSAELVLAVSLASVLRVAATALIIAGLAALLPVRQIAGLDPATVYRGR
jgi:putative ABC transport system permease protein